MAIDSTAAGYLRPSGAAPPYDKELEDIFQSVIVGITGLIGNLVRPRFQVDVPNAPAADVDWAAFGLTVERQDWQSYQAVDGSDNYVTEVTEAIILNVSFYGPNYQRHERLWCDGLQIGQNRDALLAQGITFQSFNDPVVLPALLKEQWRKRVDVRAVFHRKAVRTYPVRTLIEVGGEAGDKSGIDNERGFTPITVNPPSP